MAIIKQIASNYGIDAVYHRITNININYKRKQVVICVASYLTKEARRSNLSPLEEVDIEVPKEDFLFFKDTNVIEYAYEWLKQNVIGFEDSEDDSEVVEEDVGVDEEQTEVEETEEEEYEEELFEEWNNRDCKRDIQ